VTRKYDLRYLPAAEQDLLNILDYIGRDDPDAARRFVDRVDQAIGRLALFPKAGRQPRDARLRRLGYRVLILDDYLIFYALTGGTVQVRRVIHGARRFEFLLPDH
jgi:toxin ParE1/3/4